MKSVKNIQIGTCIQRVRILKGFKQNQVSELLSVDQSYYSKIERNKIDITWSKLQQIAAALEVSVQDIVGIENENIVFNIHHNTKAAGLKIQGNGEDKKIFYEFIESLKAENSHLKSLIDKLLHTQTNQKRKQ